MIIIKLLEISKLMENNIDKLILCGKRNLVKVIIFHFSLFTFHFSLLAFTKLFPELRKNHHL